MKHFAIILGLIILTTNTGNAAGIGQTNERPDPFTGPVEAQNPVQVKASAVLSSKERARRGVSRNTEITVSDFTAPGPRTTYTR